VRGGDSKGHGRKVVGSTLGIEYFGFTMSEAGISPGTYSTAVRAEESVGIAGIDNER